MLPPIDGTGWRAEPRHWRSSTGVFPAQAYVCHPAVAAPTSKPAWWARFPSPLPLTFGLLSAAERHHARSLLRQSALALQPAERRRSATRKRQTTSRQFARPRRAPTYPSPPPSTRGGSSFLGVRASRPWVCRWIPRYTLCRQDARDESPGEEADYSAARYAPTPHPEVRASLSIAAVPKPTPPASPVRGCWHPAT